MNIKYYFIFIVFSLSACAAPQETKQVINQNEVNCKNYVGYINNLINFKRRIIFNPEYEDISLVIWEHLYERSLENNLNLCLNSMAMDINSKFESLNKDNRYNQSAIDAEFKDGNEVISKTMSNIHHRKIIAYVRKNSTYVPTTKCDLELQVIDSMISKKMIKLGDKSFDRRAIEAANCLDKNWNS